MSINNRTDLKARNATDIKDNGGTDPTKTKGIDLREILDDYADSTYNLKDPVLQTGTGTTVLFDGCKKYVNFASPVISGNLTIDPVTNGVETSYVLLAHKRTSEPILIPFNSNVILIKLDQSAEYDPSKVNLYSFHYIEKRGTKFIVVYSIATMPVPSL